MAMCTTGSLSIKTVAGTCRSIDAAVTNCSSGSLCALSLAASKTAPHCMREFYGYNPTTAINFVEYGSSGGGTAAATKCLCVDPLPGGAGSYVICITSRVTTLFQSFGSWAQVRVYCGGTLCMDSCCLVGGTPPLVTSVSFTSDSSNKVCVLLTACARITACKGGSIATGCIYSIACDGYELGTTCVIGSAVSG